MSNRLVTLVFITLGLFFVDSCRSAGSAPEKATVPLIAGDSDALPDANGIMEGCANTEATVMPKPAGVKAGAKVLETNRPTDSNKVSKPSEVNEANSVKAATDSNVVIPAAEKAAAVSFNERLSEFFKSYIDERGMVDYNTLRPRRLELMIILGDFAALSPQQYDTWPEQEKIAFWINAYNLSTIKLIIDNYPIKPSRYKTLFYPANSIMQISEPWTKYVFNIMQVNYTLREIERRILLGEFSEPRVCFALSYATRTEPRLRNEPYVGSKLDKQLDEQVREFITSGGGFKIAEEEGTVYLSVIFDRYSEVFVRRFGIDKKFTDQPPAIRAALNFVCNYIPRQEADYLMRKNYTVKYARYDWTLNQQR